MAKAKIVTDSEGRFYGIRWDCPGCALHSEGSFGAHVLPVDWTPPGMERSPHIASRPRWGFNGDMEQPAFSPSILSRQSGAVVDGVRSPDFVCHSFIGCNGAQPGQIIFLGDCTHALAGKVVDLPEIGE